MSVKEFNLPDPGEGLTEAEIVTWKVKAGDTVKVNDIVVEIETAKSLVELPVPFAGTVTSLLVSKRARRSRSARRSSPSTPPEAPAPVPRPRCRRRRPRVRSSPAWRAARPRRWLAAAAAAEEEIEEGKIGGTTSTGRTAVLVGYGVKQTEAKRRPRKGGAQAGGVAARSQAPFPAEPDILGSGDKVEPRPTSEPGSGSTFPHDPRKLPEGGARALAKPPVRKFAKDLGVDLASVRGSGEGGIITRADVEAHAAGAAAGAPAAQAQPEAAGAATAYQAPVFARSGEREQRIPIKGVRKMMAQAMVDSAFTAPHVTEWITVDATATMELVERLKIRTASSRTSRSRRCWCWPRRCASRSAATPRSTPRGTTRRRRSWSRTT